MLSNLTQNELNKDFSKIKWCSEEEENQIKSLLETYLIHLKSSNNKTALEKYRQIDPLSIVECLRCINTNQLTFQGEYPSCYLIPYNDTMTLRISYHGLEKIFRKTYKDVPYAAKVISNSMFKNNLFLSIDSFNNKVEFNPEYKPTAEMGTIYDIEEIYGFYVMIGEYHFTYTKATVEKFLSMILDNNIPIPYKHKYYKVQMYLKTCVRCAFKEVRSIYPLPLVKYDNDYFVESERYTSTPYKCSFKQSIK